MSLSMFYGLRFMAFNKLGGTLLYPLHSFSCSRGGPRKHWASVLTLRPGTHLLPQQWSWSPVCYKNLFSFPAPMERKKKILLNVSLLSLLNFARNNHGLSSLQPSLPVRSHLYLSFPWIHALSVWTSPCSSVVSSAWSVSSFFKWIVNPWSRVILGLTGESCPVEGRGKVY